MAKWYAQLYRFVSLVSSFSLLSFGLTGMYQFLRGTHHDIYITPTEFVLGFYLTAVAGLLFLFHAGRPKFVFKYFQFLLYFVGRGLTEICLGLTTLLFCYPQHYIGAFLGALAVFSGLMSLVLACPCVDLSEDQYLSQTGDDRGWSISEKQPLLGGTAPRMHATSQDFRDLSDLSIGNGQSHKKEAAKEQFLTRDGKAEEFPGQDELRQTNPFYGSSDK